MVLETSPWPKAMTVCVDLDGTLLHGDSLWPLARSLATQPAHWKDIITCKAWTSLKALLALKGHFSAAQQPYHGPLLADLQRWRQQGHSLVLVTGAHESLAHKVAQHLGVFDEVMGSSAFYNLSGNKKARHLSQLFGAQNFCYIGNSWKDLHVWRQAYGIGIVVKKNPLSRLLLWRAQRLHPLCRPVVIYQGEINAYVHT